MKTKESSAGVDVRVLPETEKEAATTRNGGEIVNPNIGASYKFQSFVN